MAEKRERLSPPNPGVGRGGVQKVRNIEYPGDRIGRPSDEEVSFDPTFPYSRLKKYSLISENEQVSPQAEVCFLKRTTIFPINPANGQPRGSRILLKDLDANRVYGKKGKQRKVKGLSLWEAVSKAEIWNGKLKRKFPIHPGDKFTAYAKNARKPQKK